MAKHLSKVTSTNYPERSIGQQFQQVTMPQRSSVAGYLVDHYADQLIHTGLDLSIHDHLLNLPGEPVLGTCAE